MIGGGLELLVSAFRDPGLGTMVSCGAGGNLTEVIDDVVLERAPVDEALAREMLERLRVVRHGRRPARGLDPGAAIKFVTRLSRLAVAVPWRRFVLEVNPSGYARTRRWRSMVFSWWRSREPTRESVARAGRGAAARVRARV
jgi:hypothetical protein